MASNFALWLLITVVIFLVVISYNVARIAEHVEEITHGMGIG